MIFKYNNIKLFRNPVAGHSTSNRGFYMERDKELDSIRGNIYVRRFSLIVFVIVIAAIAIIELGVALGAEFLQTLERAAMWTGSFLCITIAGAGWVKKLSGNSKNSKDESPFWVTVLFTIIATGSTAGLYVPTLTTFALQTNAAMWCALFFTLTQKFPKRWEAKNIPAEP